MILSENTNYLQLKFNRVWFQNIPVTNTNIFFWPLEYH